MTSTGRSRHVPARLREHAAAEHVTAPRMLAREFDFVTSRGEPGDSNHITIRPIDGVLSRVTARPGDDHA